MSAEERDVEKDVSTRYFVSTLRRIADAIEAGKPIRIQVAGERLVIPTDAALGVAHEYADGEHELEFELRWGHGEDADEGDDEGDDAEQPEKPRPGEADPAASGADNDAPDQTEKPGGPGPKPTP